MPKVKKLTLKKRLEAADASYQRLSNHVDYITKQRDAATDNCKRLEGNVRWLKKVIQDLLQVSRFRSQNNG